MSFSKKLFFVFGAFLALDPDFCWLGLQGRGGSVSIMSLRQVTRKGMIKPTCIRMGTSSFGSALATAATLRKPLSQNTRLFPGGQMNVLANGGKGARRGANAVLLFTNVIFANASKSPLAPAFNRSEK